MKNTILSALAALALASCGEEAPKPPAVTPKVTSEPVAPTQAPQAEAKAPEAPKPDSDRELARRVKLALEGEAKIQAAAIDVTAKAGKVSLWGTAASESERRRAAEIATRVEGVNAVDNQIKIVQGS